MTNEKDTRLKHSEMMREGNFLPGREKEKKENPRGNKKRDCHRQSAA